MENSLHSTNARHFKKSILKIVNIKLEKELKKKLKKEKKEASKKIDDTRNSYATVFKVFFFFTVVTLFYFVFI